MTKTAPFKWKEAVNFIVQKDFEKLLILVFFERKSAPYFFGKSY